MYKFVIFLSYSVLVVHKIMTPSHRDPCLCVTVLRHVSSCECHDYADDGNLIMGVDDVHIFSNCLMLASLIREVHLAIGLQGCFGSCFSQILTAKW